MRRTPGKAAEFASKVPGGNCVGYETLDDLLQHPGLDAIYVSTRPGTHLDICQKVAAAGKDIYCYIEKPVGRCAQETKEIDRICQAQKLPLYTAYISRAYDRTQVIRQLLREGAIGDRLEQVTYKLVGTGGARDMNGELPWRLDAAQSGGGLIMDVGCHVVDRIDYLCGPMIQVQGSAFNKNSPRQQVEDYVHFTANIGPSDWAAMGNCEGATVECTWDFAPKDPKDACDELRFVGPIGSLKMKGGPADPIQVLDSKGGVVRELAFEFPEHTAQALIQGVTDDLRGVTKADFLSYGDNSIRTQEVIDACLEKYYGGREIGYWARSESWPGRPKNTP
jgi:1,5-anhydro-D-fructose reductase (1,5-anhydro-D-mannitol-forming)